MDDGPTLFLDGRVTLHAGDSREVVRGLAANSIDAVVTDPPYALVSIVKRFGKAGAKPTTGGDVYARAGSGFMGKIWDTGETAFDPAFWAEVLRVAKPGAHLVAFSGTRSYHRLACAIEDAGWEIRDQLAWAYGSGFPKSHDVERGIAEMQCTLPGRHYARSIPAEAKRRDGDHVCPPTPDSLDHEGEGTALKPAWEPIAFARKPLEGTVAANVQAHGTGAINVDGCRVEGTKPLRENTDGAEGMFGMGSRVAAGSSDVGRWPANLIHDGSPEVLAAFPGDAGAGGKASGPTLRGGNNSVARGTFNGLPEGVEPAFHADSGSAARFFYTAKADGDDRLGSGHPTVKPVDLMQWLVRLVARKGGVVLDPFAGTGTTGEAAWREGMNAVLIERDPEYLPDIARRMELVLAPPRERRQRSHQAKAERGKAPAPAGDGGLFDLLQGAEG